MEPLEDRQLLSVNLLWDGTGTALHLVEDAAGATPSVIISEPTSNSSGSIDASTAQVGTKSKLDTLSETVKPNSLMVFQTDVVVSDGYLSLSGAGISEGITGFGFGTDAGALPPDQVVTTGDSSVVTSATVDQLPGGGVPFRIILGTDLPSTPTPIGPQPPPTPLVLDIAPVLTNRIPTVEGPFVPSESIASPPVIVGSASPPVIVGSGSSPVVAPPTVVSKPDVEGNCGKSQIIDVASCWASPAKLTARTVEGPGGTAARRNEPSNRTESAIALVSPGENASSARFTAFSWEDRGTSVSPARSRYVAVAADASDTAVADRSSVSEYRAAQFEPGSVAAEGQTVVVSIRPGTADATVSASAKATTAVPLSPREDKGVRTSARSLAADTFYRIGCAMLALAGHHFRERLPRLAPAEPRPTTLRRRKPRE
jgi:hypothetical protein